MMKLSAYDMRKSKRILMRCGMNMIITYFSSRQSLMLSQATTMQIPISCHSSVSCPDVENNFCSGLLEERRADAGLGIFLGRHENVHKYCAGTS